MTMRPTLNPTSLLVLTLFATACAPEPETTPSSAPTAEAPAVATAPAYKDVSVTELQTMLANKDFPLINVHVPFEGDLPGTDFSIPYDDVESHLSMLPEDKDAPIVLYCRTGRMSIMAAEELAGRGYTNLYNLAGGFVAWTAAGLPMAEAAGG